MLHSDPNLLVTFFTTHEEERNVADEISKALRCKPVSFKDLLSNTEKIPPTQTRLVFHGHGGTDIFGSQDHHFSADEFANEIIKILKMYPDIKDIDLLSCNLGLLDEKDNCYAVIVQSRLDEAGFGHVNVNTFLVENKDKKILDSFFVAGRGKETDAVFLDKGMFSLDILREDNVDQVKAFEKIRDIERQLGIEKEKMDLLQAISSACGGEDETSIDKVKSEMKHKGYNERQIASIFKDYDLKIHTGDFDTYFTCNIIDPEKKYTYPKEARYDSYLLERPCQQLELERSEAHILFARLRSTQENTRIFTGKTEDIQSYLVPVRVVADHRLQSQIIELSKLKEAVSSREIGEALMQVANAYKKNDIINLLDVYVKNLAQVFIDYKSTNVDRIQAINALSVEIGIAYVNCMHKSMPINECIDILKHNVNDICDSIRQNHKEKGTLSFPKFFGGVSLTSSSLAKNITEAMEKSDELIRKRQEVPRFHA